MMIRYNYMHKGELLCHEWVDNSHPEYKLSLTMTKIFYYFSSGWETEFGFDSTRELELVMKFVKIKDGDYYFESTAVIKDDFLFE